MIRLTQNRGYSWTETKNIYFKGYFEVISDQYCKVFRKDDAIQCLCTIKNDTEFLSFLKRIDGVYAIIIDLGGTILFATDRSRSMPLYYSTKYNIISDSAEEIKKEIAEIDGAVIDFDQYLTLFSNDFLIGHNTVYREINQLDLGEMGLLHNGEVKLTKYFYHYAPIVKAGIDDYKAQLNNAAYRTFERIKAAIGDRPVVLSMSGGYDSRFVGCMLKKIGITDVSCYTYGKQDSFEVAQSKKNAEALGFRWAFVEHTDEEVTRTIDDVGQQYFNSYEGHDFTAYIQNFPAVRKLHEDGWFKPNSVFITGLCGDMPTGNYILPFDDSKEYSSKTAAERVYQLIFCRYEMPEVFRQKWINEMEEEINNLPLKVKDYQSWISAVDCIYTGTCHSHWFMHMNSVHSFFGYEWLLPYWDSELLTTWYRIPAEIREKQSLYEDWLLNDICAPYGINTKKYRATYSRNKYIRNAKYVVGGVLNYLILRSGHVFKRKYDYNNFAPLEAKLYAGLLSKKTVFYRKGGIMFLLNQYLLQRRYGVEIMRKACKLVKVRKS